MKKLSLLFCFVSSLALAQTGNEVTPTPVDNQHTAEDIKGTIAPPTPEQKAKVEAPIKKAAAKHKAVKKAKKAKKAKKHKKTH